MGIGASLALGFIKGVNSAKAERTEKERLEREALLEQRKDLTTGLADLVKKELIGGQPASTIQLGIDSGQITSMSQIYGAINTMGEAAGQGLTLEGAGGQSVYIPFGEELNRKDYSAFEAAEVKLAALNEYLTYNGPQLGMFLTTPGNEMAASNFYSTLQGLEIDARVGHRKSLSAANAEFIPYGFQNRYPNLVQFGQALGFERDEETLKERLNIDVNYDPATENVVFFNYKGVLSNDRETSAPVVIDKNYYNKLGNLASATGHPSVQAMLDEFTYYDKQAEQEEGESDQAFIMRQNKALQLAVDFEERGYGSILRNEVGADAATVEEMLAYIDEKTRNSAGDSNNQLAVMSLAALRGSPKQYFEKSKTNFIFATVQPSLLKPKFATPSEFLEDLTGLKAADFKEGFDAQNRAVKNLNRLIELEGQMTDTTGFARSFFASTQRIGTQLGQLVDGGKATLAGVFGLQQEEGAFSDKTSIATLTSVVEQVNKTSNYKIDLANLSEMDVLRLTLAADMARAVDPSGRLSNQDFEIQLRRLGQHSLASPEEIIVALKVVREQFTQDLAIKNEMQRIYNNKSELTPIVAKRMMVEMDLRDFRRQVAVARYGGQITATPTDETTEPDVVEGIDPTSGGYTLNPARKGPGGEDVYTTLQNGKLATFIIKADGLLYPVDRADLQ